MTEPIPAPEPCVPGGNRSAPAIHDLAERLRARGEPEMAEELERVIRQFIEETLACQRRIGESLSVTHDMNNALVGVYGNAQLLGLGPASAIPGVKERLEVIVHEAARIRDAILCLTELKAELTRGEPSDEGRAP
jgi:signal transduction histidine kinase